MPLISIFGGIRITMYLDEHTPRISMRTIPDIGQSFAF